MTMTPQIAATRIGRELREAEENLDQLLLRQSRILNTLIQASLDVEAPFAEMQLPLARLGRVQQQLIEARSSLIHAHGELRKMGDARADIMTDCPPTKAALTPVAGQEAA